MKEQILNYLRTYPNGARQREIASALCVWTGSRELIESLRELKQEGLIKSTLYRDIGNMEWYDIWKVV